MKKKIYLLTITAIGAFSLSAYYIGNSEIPKITRTHNNVDMKQSNVSEQTRDKKVIPLKWKTYSNKRFNFTFQYPRTWIKNGKHAEVVNSSGTITVIEINFIDTLSKTDLSIQYHLAPNGADLYKYAVSQYDSSQGWYATGGKQIEVAGNKAIEAFTTIHVDGKGNPLKPPLRLIVVDFLDKQQTGEIELQFKTPLTNDKEIAGFKRLLSTFKFSS